MTDEMTDEAITMNGYQAAAARTAVYPVKFPAGGLGYCALGVAGEAGEVAEVVKKTIRDHGGVVDDERRALLAKELGDVLWYVAMLAREAGLDLEDVARGNLDKLADRKARNVLHGAGGDR